MHVICSFATDAEFTVEELMSYKLLLAATMEASGVKPEPVQPKSPHKQSEQVRRAQGPPAMDKTSPAKPRAGLARSGKPQQLASQV